MKPKLTFKINLENTVFLRSEYKTKSSEKVKTAWFLFLNDDIKKSFLICYEFWAFLPCLRDYAKYI